jgi:outer membrane protein
MLAGAPAAARAESIVSALASAYAYSPTLMSALLSVKSAAETVAIRKSATLPNISANVNAADNLSTVPGGTIANSQTLGLALNYKQTLFDSFQTDSQVEQARALVELSTFALANQEQNVLLAVVNAYMDVVRDSTLIRLRQENLAFFEAQVSSAEERLKIQQGTKIDVAQAQARRAQAVAAYRAAIASLQTSQATFQRYVGHKPQNLKGEFPYDRLLPKSLDTAIHLGETRHPAILSAEASIRAAQAGSDAARGAFGPTLSLIGQVCALCFSSTTQSVTANASVQLSLSIPLYAGGALGAGARKANLEQIKSEVDALGTRDQVREAVISAWSAMQNAAAQIESAQVAVDTGQEVVAGVVQERDVGEATTIDVLNAQADLATAREALLQAQTSRVVAAFALIASTGRLSAKDLGLNVEIKSGAAYQATVEDVWAELRAIDE